MNIKIYHQNKQIYLTDNLEEIDRKDEKDFIVYQMEELDGFNIQYAISVDQCEHLIFLHKDFLGLKKSFFHNFEQIQAAGGIVENKDGKILLIYRRGFWDLPKGKRDPGESLEECAKREIEEETGVNALILHHLLSKTYHTYLEKNQYILKETFWYYLTTTFEKQLIPQTEEGIESLLWVEKEALPQYTLNTYLSLMDVFEQYLKKPNLKS